MIAVVGGGITGLTLAWLLHEKGEDVQLFEASNRTGGNIQSVREAGCLLEVGPNSLRLNDFLYQYLDRLGLTSEIVYAKAEARYRYILRDGAYRRLPTGPVSLLFNSFFSLREKLRIMREWNVPPGGPANETVDAFFRRRFGDAVADYAVAPFISGIYAGDPRTLDVAEAFPRVKKWEQTYGSVIRGAIKGGGKNKHKGIISLSEGLEMLPNRLAEKLGDRLHTEQPLESLNPTKEGYQLSFANRDSVVAEQVVLALPAFVIARLMREVDPAVAADLDRIYYPPVALVHSLYRREDVGHALDGFGGLNNHREGRATLGTIFSSSTFADRAPEETVLLTSFVGGAHRPERTRKAANEIQADVHAELSDLLQARNAPIFQKCTVYPRAIPQYEHRALASRTHANAWAEKGLHLAGNWIGGISVVACIEQAHELCEQLSPSGA